MEFLLIAAAVAALGTVPLLAGRRFTMAGWQFVAALLIGWGITYFFLPSLVWPWWGGCGLGVLFWWVVAALLNFVGREANNHRRSNNEDENAIAFGGAFPVLLAVLMLLSMTRGCEVIRADDYAKALGTVNERTWTQDIQPKDPRHIRMGSVENAMKLAQQTLGQAGSIGSQFVLREDSASPQLVNGKFEIIIPVDFNGWLVWRSTGKVPGYVLVNGEDPTVPGEFVQLPPDQQFRYTPEACWEYNLERLLWSRGYNRKALAGFRLERDDANGKPWWVSTVYEPTVFASVPKVLGVVVVDPVSGHDQFHEIGKVPSWIDVVVPPDFVKDFISWRGEYHSGWMNSWNEKKNLIKPEEPVMVYGSENEPLYVTGATSKKDTDSSLVGLYYTNSRTGKTVFYKAEGSTDAAVTQAVNNNEQVKFRHLHAAVPQVYNIYGTMAAIMPLLNENHLFQGVAVVNIKNIQVLGIGQNQFEAIRNYQNALSATGKQAAPDLTRTRQKATGVVEVNSAIFQNGQVTFYLKLKGVPHVFTAGISLSPEELPVTIAGHRVTVEYYASGEKIEPMHSFDNLDIVLEGTAAEAEVRAAGEVNRAKTENKAEAKTLRENLKSMSDEELLKLKGQVK